MVYSETHSPTTNSIGLFNLQIGGGTVVSGDFSAIDWGSDTYFLKREIDPSGGSNYIISGTSQILSVPYALHSKTANRLSPDIYIGKDTFGGIVFHIDRYPNKITGLVVAKVETTAAWSNLPITVGAISFSDGQFNTDKMIDSPAKDYVTGLREGGFDDWYIPSPIEFYLIFNNIISLNNQLKEYPISIDTDIIGQYCTSQEITFRGTIGDSDTHARPTNCVNPSPGLSLKTNQLKIRAIRKFEIAL